jgi:membrane protein DedA with SNARE-associated domain
VASDAVAPYLDVLGLNLYAAVFVVSAVDATGLPVPGRLVLIAAGALSVGRASAVTVILLAAAGAFVGDHLLYYIGRLGGTSLLAWYCRWTMGSGRCIHATARHFASWGAAAIVIGRFVAGVRLFTAAFAGSGSIPYHRFLVFDALGALIWAASFVLLGRWLGYQWPGTVRQFAGATTLLAVVLAAGMTAILLFRFFRRRRHGPATGRRLVSSAENMRHPID